MSRGSEPRRRTPCRHCHRCNAKRRGLCYAHYYDPEVRAMYAPLVGTFTGRRKGDPEPTEEELDATIAEQSRPENLPDWWWYDVRMQSLGVMDPDERGG